MKRDLIILFAFILLSAAPVWTPLVTDSTLSGIGTTDSPLSIDTTKIATRYYSGSLTGGARSTIYRALLTQSGTSAPTATVLANTLGGTVVWSYVDVGTYLGTLTGAFAGDVICAPNLGIDNNGYGLSRPYTVYKDSDDAIGVSTYSDYSGTGSNDVLNGAAYIEIRVYP